jgi:hypothetical protein
MMYFYIQLKLFYQFTYCHGRGMNQQTITYSDKWNAVHSNTPT